MTKNAIIAICISLVISSCSEEEFQHIVGQSGNEETTKDEFLQFKSATVIGAPAANENNVGNLRYTFEDGDQIGLFGIPYSDNASAEVDMSAMADISGFHFFNLPMTYQDGQPMLYCEEKLNMPVNKNLLVYAYYPYTNDISYNEYGWSYTWNFESTDIIAELSQLQDLLYSSKPTEVTSSREPITLSSMNHAFGALAFRFYTNDPLMADKKVLSSQISTIQYNKSGSVSLNDGLTHLVAPSQVVSRVDILKDLNVNIIYSEDSASLPLSFAYIVPAGFRFRNFEISYYSSSGKRTTKTIDASITIESGKINIIDFFITGTATRSNNEGETFVKTNIITKNWNEIYQ